MNLSPKSIARYTALSDREIVDRIIREHDMEAGVYLLWYRYESLIHSHYTNVFNNSISYLYEDALISLYITLCGENGEWKKLASFNWQCKFSSWLSIVSLRYFYSIKDKMQREYEVCSISINDVDEKLEEEVDMNDNVIDHNSARLLLIESIGQMKNEYFKYVLLKRLQGFNSTEIANMMKTLWEIQGVAHKDSKGCIITPSAAYIDCLTQRAKKELRGFILSKIKSDNN